MLRLRLRFGHHHAARLAAASLSLLSSFLQCFSVLFCSVLFFFRALCLSLSLLLRSVISFLFG
jgi:hypothetical protein